MATTARKPDSMTAEPLTPPSAPMLTQSPIPEPDDIADPPVPAAVTEAIMPASAAVVSAVSVSALPPGSRPGLALHAQADIDQYVHESLQRALSEQPTVGLHDALLQGFCSVLQQRVQAFMLEEHKGIMQTLDATLVALRKWVETVGAKNEHSEYQLSDALLKLQEHGLALRHDPYTATVAAVAPGGFEVSIRVAKQGTDELVTTLTALLAWLSQEGFSAVPRGSLAGTL